jgi:hypothetical protein
MNTERCRTSHNHGTAISAFNDDWAGQRARECWVADAAKPTKKALRGGGWSWIGDTNGWSFQVRQSGLQMHGQQPRSPAMQHESRAKSVVADKFKTTTR